VLFPHILARQDDITKYSLPWVEIVENADMIVAFGGIPVRNTMVGSGGNSRHIARGSLQAAVERGVRLVSISPIADDLEGLPRIDWLPIVPSTDTALMLGMAFVLETENLCDRSFLKDFCSGYSEFREYLLGRSDGYPKDPAWASKICGIDASEITALARQMAASRCLVSVAFSLQRAERGEQPLWMGVTLAAMLGQIGLKGRGFSYGLGSSGTIGKSPLQVSAPAFRQGTNPVKTFIPVSRIADMLLSPGATYDYDGQLLRYPDIKLVYWAGGNPFHHHQDLQRLSRAFGQPDTVVVQDPYFTATARHADFVLPSTITLERDDIGASQNDPLVVAMHKVVEPIGEAKDDYWIFAELAKRLGREQHFTEGRTAQQWIQHLYEELRQSLAKIAGTAPEFQSFWRDGEVTLPIAYAPGVIERFRANPVAHPLKTASGRIEITSEGIRRFGYADCGPHPRWIEHDEWLGSDRAKRFSLQMVANQPATRLHSQLDFGDYSAESKVAGREPIRIHPSDAGERGIADGQIVRVFNDRGSCLAGAVLSEALRPGVVQLSTGAWYQPQDLPEIGMTCVHGNPNILAKDIGTSRLAQGCAGQLTLVEIEPYFGDAPPVTVHRAPDTKPADRQLLKQRSAMLRSAQLNKTSR
jgi:biotin/methionine sulfoxide reductase